MPKKYFWHKLLLKDYAQMLFFHILHSLELYIAYYFSEVYVLQLLFTAQYRKREPTNAYFFICWLIFGVSNQAKKYYSFLPDCPIISATVYGFPSHSLCSAIYSFIPFL